MTAAAVSSQDDSIARMFMVINNIITFLGESEKCVEIFEEAAEV